MSIQWRRLIKYYVKYSNSGNIDITKKINNIMTEPYLTSLITLVCIYSLSVISPGPDFAIVVRNSLAYSRKTGLFTAFGVSFGALFHITYVLFGLGIIIAESKVLLNIVKYIGALYLFYLGIKGIMAKKHISGIGTVLQKTEIPPHKAFLTGFMTNVLNPKSILFYISIFSSLIPSSAPRYIIAINILLILSIKIIWFSFVAIILSGKRTREKFMRYTYLIERIAGCALVALSIKLLLF